MVEKNGKNGKNGEYCDICGETSCICIKMPMMGFRRCQDLITSITATNPVMIADAIEGLMQDYLPEEVSEEREEELKDLVIHELEDNHLW